MVNLGSESMLIMHRTSLCDNTGVHQASDAPCMVLCAYILPTPLTWLRSMHIWLTVYLYMAWYAMCEVCAIKDK